MGQSTSQTNEDFAPAVAAAQAKAQREAADYQRQAATFMATDNERQVGDYTGPEGNIGEA